MKISFTGLLFILFLGLKLTGFIAWSWVWITAPLWIPLALCAVICACVGVVMLVASAKDVSYVKKN